MLSLNGPALCCGGGRRALALITLSVEERESFTYFLLLNSVSGRGSLEVGVPGPPGEAGAGTALCYDEYYAKTSEENELTYTYARS